MFRKVFQLLLTAKVFVEIVELELNEEEKAKFAHSVKVLKETMAPVL